MIRKGSTRSVNFLKNVLSMLLLKGGCVIIGLVLVPLTIDYVDSERYGIWLTLSSMVAWIHFFDVGINNGLRNVLGRAFAKNDIIAAKRYISTTYAIMAIIFIPVMFFLLIINQYLDWNKLLNIRGGCEDISLVASILIAYFCINFILSTINVILMSNQRPADASLRLFIQQLFSLLVIYIFTINTQGNLVNLCIGMCVAPLIVLFLFNITLFHGRYKAISPSIKYVDFSVAPDLVKLGVQFFVIQIAGLIQYQMINFLIIRNYGSSEVTSYNIAYRYFSVLTMIWGILTTPIWSAVTDAYVRNDIEWIKMVIRRYLVLLGLFILGGLLMLAVSDIVYQFWIGNKVEISLNLSIWVMLYNFMTMFCGVFVSITNGCSKLKWQTYACMVSPLIFVSLCYIFVHVLSWGVSSILIAAIACNFNGYILAPIQCKKIVNENAFK